MAKELKNYIGLKFSKVTIIAEAERYISPKGQKIRTFVCQCECGRTKIFRRTHLGYKGKVISCGKCGLHRKLDKPVSLVTYAEASELALKAKSIKTFKDEYPALYAYINKNGWHNKIFSHLPRLKGRKRSDDELKEIVSEYKTFEEFKVKEKMIYDAIRKYKKYYLLIPLVGYEPVLTDEEVGVYYDTCKDINKTAEYFNILRNTVINKLRRLDHPDIPKSYLLNFTEEEIIAEARKYDSRNGFYTNSPQHYTYARRHGMLDKAYGHLEPLLKYDKELVAEIAKKFKTKTEFNKHAGGAYSWALKHKIIDEVCHHMEKRGNRKSKVIYSYEFVKENAVYVGLTYRPTNRDTSHRSETSSSVYKFGVKVGYIPEMKILTDEYVNPEEANRLEQYYLDEYIQNGWIALNRAKTGTQGQRSKYEYYTDEQLHQIALKYKTRNDMIKSPDKSAYRHITNNKKEQLLTHMVGREKWNKERVTNVAKNYKTRTEFYNGFRKAYDWAVKNKMLDEVCSHMVSDIIYHTEESVKDVVAKYKTIKEFRDNNPREYQWVSKRKDLYEKLCGHLIKYDNSIKISIDGIIYSSYTEAKQSIGKSITYICNRVHNDDYPNYYIV